MIRDRSTMSVEVVASDVVMAEDNEVLLCRDSSLRRFGLLLGGGNPKLPLPPAILVQVRENYSRINPLLFGIKCYTNSKALTLVTRCQNYVTYSKYSAVM